MLYEFVFSCSGAGEDSPFCLCQGLPLKQLIPCSSTLSITEAGIAGLVTVERGDQFELLDPIKLLPFAAEVSSRIPTLWTDTVD